MTERTTKRIHQDLAPKATRNNPTTDRRTADRELVDSYSQATRDLDSFGVAIKSLIDACMLREHLTPHSVTFRVKAIDSATEKLTGSDKYNDYPALTDLLGVRVITYFADTVDRVAEALKPEFDIDEANSVDKRAALDPDRFGYLSVHYIAKLKPTRTSLVEYAGYDGLQFELQIRSILQHAWAEIEHDLGYKAAGGLPRELRRRFSRLAGLLELADDEFQRLRDDRERYEARVDRNLANRPQEFEVDQSTITAFLTSSLSRTLDIDIAHIFNSDLAEHVDDRYAAFTAAELRLLGVRNILTLTEAVETRRSFAIEFAKIWLGVARGASRARRTNPLQAGIGLFYIRYTLVATSDQIRRRRWSEQRKIDILPKVDETWAQVVALLGDPPLVEGLRQTTIDAGAESSPSDSLAPELTQLDTAPAEPARIPRRGQSARTRKGN